jgi:hypothetical protein
VDDCVADVLINDAAEPGLDHLFTPERLAHIDKAAAQMKAGESYSIEEVREHLAEARAEWIRKNGQ